MLGLLVAVVLMLGVVAMRQTDTGVEEKRHLLPDINLATIDQVVVNRAGSVVTLQQQGDQWVIEEKQDYLADFESLRQMMEALSDAGKLERKTTRAENHARLGLVAPGESGNATRIVAQSEDAVSFDLLVGDTATGQAGQFVRFSGDDQVWLIDQQVSVPETARDWLAPIIINVSPDALTGIEYRDETGDTVLQVHSVDGDWVADDQPADRELVYPTVFEELSRSLTNVRLEDVFVHLPERWQDPRSVIFYRKEGPEIEAMAIEIDGTHWLHFNGDLAAWDYQVAEYVYQDFIKTMEDILKPLEEPEKKT